MSAESSAGAEKLWTPANIITLVRICLVPVCSSLHFLSPFGRNGWVSYGCLIR